MLPMTITIYPLVVHVPPGTGTASCPRDSHVMIFCCSRRPGRVRAGCAGKSCGYFLSLVLKMLCGSKGRSSALPLEHH